MISLRNFVKMYFVFDTKKRNTEIQRQSIWNANTKYSACVVFQIEIQNTRFVFQIRISNTCISNTPHHCHYPNPNLNPNPGVTIINSNPRLLCHRFTNKVCLGYRLRKAESGIGVLRRPITSGEPLIRNSVTFLKVLGFRVS